MAHGLDDVETGQAAALPRRAADRILAFVNGLVVKASSAALVAAGFVLTYSVIVRYFLKISTDWQDETSVFLIIGAVFLSSSLPSPGLRFRRQFERLIHHRTEATLTRTRLRAMVRSTASQPASRTRRTAGTRSLAIPAQPTQLRVLERL